jgi:heat shock protein HspQ
VVRIRHGLNARQVRDRPSGQAPGVPIPGRDLRHPQFANSEEWWNAIPEDIRPRRDQPFYHLLAENGDSTYVAYVSEQNLLPDESGQPVAHPQTAVLFDSFDEGAGYRLKPRITH